MRFHNRWAALWVCLAVLCAAVPQAAAQTRAVPVEKRELPKGRPEVVLDRLDFPHEIQGWWVYKKHLRKVLKREVRRVEWGAGTGNRIEYRFAVTELKIETEGDLVQVTCTAIGRLPKGKRAKSHLSFGGSKAKRGEVVRKVLEIVARGVIARLAELERERRGYD
ncbi:MAG: hypothetical protein KC492_07195 [Myxococcales bacterium]|nr:hypothetical protein [Myxococcales bacterium]MCB9609224.1 hypothetical protein [Polyangiaceae bacterium]